MKREQLDDMFNRLAYLTEAAQLKRGVETGWTYALADGSMERIIVRGLRSHEHMRYDVESLLVWTWSAKDHVKRRARALGKDPRSIEVAAESDARMRVCRDLANSLKHAGRDEQAPRRDRTLGRHLTLGPVRMSIPGHAFQVVLVLQGEIDMRVAEPEAADITFPVIDEQGTELDEAFAVASHGVAFFERARVHLERGP